MGSTCSTSPVDAVDLACRAHNRCYGLLGDFHDRCERNFVELRRVVKAARWRELGRRTHPLCTHEAWSERNAKPAPRISFASAEVGNR